ncbi:hypothetical protein AX14_010377 [Amanita brunnescens Koide BX004]|nr:hypothetical protein AX14_010377 [Amanita brunnescens Koide BX004]
MHHWEETQSASTKRGPAQVETLGKRRYYVTFMDDWSHWTTIYLLREKSETFAAYKSYYAWVLNQLGKTIKCLHTDRGGEYLSDKFISFLDEHGVGRKLMVHDTPEENGVAERLNRMLQEKVHAMMYGTKLPLGLWGEALMHATWLKNRTWTWSLLRGLTPYEMVTGEAPVLLDMPEWGAVECAKEGQWVGYDLNSKGHRIYWCEKTNITVECSVTFTKESIEPTPDDKYFALDEPRGSNDDNGLTQNKDAERMVEVQKPINQTLPDIRRSGREKQPSQYIRDLQSGEFTTGLPTEAIPKGMQLRF